MKIKMSEGSFKYFHCIYSLITNDMNWDVSVKKKKKRSKNGTYLIEKKKEEKRHKKMSE